MDYNKPIELDEFIKSKQNIFQASGFEIEESKLNNLLKPFQKWCVKLSLSKGKFALWADCGLGKTFMQLEWSKQVSIKTGKPVIIVCPLAVSGQTIREGEKFSIKVEKQGLSVNINGNLEEIEPYEIIITNYEQLENIDCSVFGGVVIDESSILKNYSGAYKKLILEKFLHTQYKLACSGTPSPNDELEVGNHAEFLNICTSQDMRAMYFTTDKDRIKGDKFRLKKHSIKAFYKWIASWAIMFSKPSEIGFEDDGYVLPPLNFIEKKIITESRSSTKLFNSVAVSATNFNSELRLTKIERLSEVVDIVNSTDEQFIIWIKHNEEGDYLRKLIPGAVEISGSDTIEYKERNILSFQESKFRVLISKSKIVQFGLNFQNCHNQVFASLDFSFESLYQSIRRSYRFGQKNKVNIYLITTDTMQNVIQSIEEKQEKFIRMQIEMREAMLSHLKHETVEYVREEVSNNKYKVVYGDCLDETRSMPSNSVDYSFFSPPFAAMYVFSNDVRDMSNVRNYDEFLTHFSYLVPELLRVTKPGRIVSLHIMQSTTLLGKDGYYSIKDFRGDIIRMFQKEGFYFHEEHMIRKDPKTAAIRTKNRQLMWGTTKKDSTIVRPGLADYILSFKKPGENKVPVANNIPFELWCEMAEPVWLQIEEGDTLEFRSAKDNDDERHLTPTQLKPIDWCTQMYCNRNKGEVMYVPFAGIGSEGDVAIKNGIFYYGVELKKSYFDVCVKNCIEAEKLSGNQSVFNL